MPEITQDDENELAVAAMGSVAMKDEKTGGTPAQRQSIHGKIGAVLTGAALVGKVLTGNPPEAKADEGFKPPQVLNYVATALNVNNVPISVSAVNFALPGDKLNIVYGYVGPIIIIDPCWVSLQTGAVNGLGTNWGLLSLTAGCTVGNFNFNGRTEAYASPGQGVHYSSIGATYKLKNFLTLGGQAENLNGSFGLGPQAGVNNAIGTTQTEITLQGFINPVTGEKNTRLVAGVIF